VPDRVEQLAQHRPSFVLADVVARRPAVPLRLLGVLMRMPSCARARRTVALAAAALAATGAVAVAGGTAWASTGTDHPQVRADDCTPQHVSGCTGTDSPADPSLLRYCGPDGTCAPVGHRGGRHH
jgi:hypothetical protein